MNCPKCNEDIMSMSVHYCNSKPERTMNDTPTPRTDDASIQFFDRQKASFILSEMAQLERELTAVTEQRDAVTLRLGNTQERMFNAEKQRDRLADLTKQFIKILDITEESDSGRLFHPTNITSCRAGDLQKIGELVEALRGAGA